MPVQSFPVCQGDTPSGHAQLQQLCFPGLGGWRFWTSEEMSGWRLLSWDWTSQRQRQTTLSAVIGNPRHLGARKASPSFIQQTCIEAFEAYQQVPGTTGTAANKADEPPLPGSLPAGKTLLTKVPFHRRINQTRTASFPAPRSFSTSAGILTTQCP